jgi:hypothetical protein
MGGKREEENIEFFAVITLYPCLPPFAQGTRCGALYANAFQIALRSSSSSKAGILAVGISQVWGVRGFANM